MNRGKPNGVDHSGGLALIPMPQLLSVSDWLWAEIPPPDYLMGQLLSTTTRATLAAPTGIGKTNFCMALALAMAEGRDFLHWRAGRNGPAKILYVDGEMSKRLMKQRIVDAVRRANFKPESVDVPDSIVFVCFDELPIRPQPLNTAEGQEWFDRFLEGDGYDFVVFDNIQSLLAGNMAEEEPWKEILPWTYSLTKRAIGQLWVHHTGHNKSRGYGTSTRDWQMDTSMLLEETERPSADIAFGLTFLKARERAPDNRADFEPVVVTLERDQWFVEKIEEGKPKERAAPAPKPKSPSPLSVKFYDALTDAICVAGSARPQSAGRMSVSEDEWVSELTRLSLINGEKPHSKRALISKHRRELLAANWVAANAGFIWSLKSINR